MSVPSACGPQGKNLLLCPDDTVHKHSLASLPVYLNELLHRYFWILLYSTGFYFDVSCELQTFNKGYWLHPKMRFRCNPRITRKWRAELEWEKGFEFQSGMPTKLIVCGVKQQLNRCFWVVADMLGYWWHFLGLPQKGQILTRLRYFAVLVHYISSRRGWCENSLSGSQANLMGLHRLSSYWAIRKDGQLLGSNSPGLH